MVPKVIVFVLAFFAMELVAWASHKYVMHGFLWRWHKDHHRYDRNPKVEAKQTKGWFEKNDLFFLFFAVPAMLFIFFGLLLQMNLLVVAGIGISFYGLVYFALHDIVIHKRLPLHFLQKIPGAYFKALVKAHSAHHWAKSTEDFKNFGLLFFSFRYFSNN